MVERTTISLHCVKLLHKQCVQTLEAAQSALAWCLCEVPTDASYHCPEGAYLQHRTCGSQWDPKNCLISHFHVGLDIQHAIAHPFADGEGHRQGPLATYSDPKRCSAKRQNESTILQQAHSLTASLM